MPVRSGGSAPYAPPATVLQLIHGFRDKGLVTPFTADVLVRAGVTESLVPRVMRSLVGLELIDEAGNPTPAMDGLRRVSAADFKTRLAEIIRDVYAEVFQFTDPAADSPEKVADAFRAYDPIGQRGRMVTLFLGLCEAAGIIKESAVRKAAPSGAAPRTAKKAEPSRKGPSFSASANIRTNDGGVIPPALLGVLAALPSAGAGWTQKRRDDFVKMFETVLDFSVPIQRDAGAGADEADEDE